MKFKIIGKSYTETLKAAYATDDLVGRFVTDVLYDMFNAQDDKVGETFTVVILPEEDGISFFAKLTDDAPVAVAYAKDGEVWEFED